MLPLLVALAVAPPPDPGLFARATHERSLRGRTFLLPGMSWVTWAPLKREVADLSRAGLGLEVSVARWLTNDFYVGGLAQFEHVGRSRVGLGLQAGYELVGVEISAARELPADGNGGQWSLQVAPFVSFGILWISPRWVVALDKRGVPGQPGDGVMFVVGVKLPLGIGGAREPGS